MKSFEVDNLNIPNKHNETNTKDLWVLLFALILVLTMWKNYSPFLTLCLSAIVVFQASFDTDSTRKNLKLYSAIMGGIFFMVLTNGKEVPLRFTNPDVFNIPLWVLPFFSILFSGFYSIIETSKIYF